MEHLVACLDQLFLGPRLQWAAQLDSVHVRIFGDEPHLCVSEGNDSFGAIIGDHYAAWTAHEQLPCSYGGKETNDHADPNHRLPCQIKLQ